MLKEIKRICGGSYVGALFLFLPLDLYLVKFSFVFVMYGAFLPPCPRACSNIYNRKKKKKGGPNALKILQWYVLCSKVIEFINSN